MSGGWAFAAVLPQKAVPAVARRAALTALALCPAIRKRGVDELRRRLDPPDPHGLFLEHYKRRYEHVLGRILDTQGRGWHPEIELTGLEHFRRAQAKGQGTILWGMSFCGPVIAKAALFRAGIPVMHLSTPYHGGFSRSLLAARILNPWNLKSENKYLDGRIVIPMSGSMEYLRLLKQRLSNNGCVSIMGEHAGRQNVSVPFLLKEERFATGPANLARSTGASLLTIHSFRLGPGHYRVVVEPPIETPWEEGRSQGFRTAIEEFARRLEAHVREHPADWEGWSVLPIA